MQHKLFHPAAFALLALPILAACGFQPLYGTTSTTRADTRAGAQAVPADHLAQILILPIEDRLGQQMYNALRDDLNPTGIPAAPHYALSLRLGTHEQKLGFRFDRIATRANLHMLAEYQLIDVRDNRVLLIQHARATSSYNIIESGFSNYSSHEDALARGVLEISSQIRNRLAGYFALPEEQRKSFTEAIIGAEENDETGAEESPSEAQ